MKQVGGPYHVLVTLRINEEHSVYFCSFTELQLKSLSPDVGTGECAGPAALSPSDRPSSG